MKKIIYSVCLLVVACGLLMLAPSAHAAGLRILGALSNFDCYNDTPDDAEGFEIEIEGLHKEDVAGTWAYSAFGAPTVTTIGTVAAPSVLIHYHSDTKVVAAGGITHFGVTLSTFTQPGTMQRRWLIKATTVQPNPVPSPVTLPSHQSQVVSSSGVSSVRDGIKNESPDGGTVYWIVPYINTIKRAVKLDELMTNNTVVQNSTALGNGVNGTTPIRLDPADLWTNDDAVGEDDTESGVFSYDVYADIVTVDANGNDVHTAGALIATIMDASVTGKSAASPSVLTLSDASVYGPQVVTGMITLNGAAPIGGTVVQLTSSSTSATVPASVTVPANASSVTFTITANAVVTLTNVNITATSGGGLRSASFAIMPPTLSTVWLAYRNARGGTSFTGTVYLLGMAPTGGLKVSLSSNSTLAAVPKTVTVPAGATSVSFTVTSQKVTRTVSVTITANSGSASKSASVNLIH